jgi:branched-chain amino acid transport system substrate-binding protein
LVVAERNKVVYWETAAIANQITRRGAQYLFRTIVTADDLGFGGSEYAAKVIAPLLKADPKALKLAIAHEDGPFGTDQANAAEARATELGMQVVAKEAYNAPKMTDFTPMIVKWKSLAPDVITLIPQLNDAILFWKQARELDLNVKAFVGGGSGLAIPDFVTARGDDVNGIMLSDVPVDFNPAGLLPEAQAERQEFLERYRKKSDGRDPASHATVSFLGTSVLFKHVLPTAGTDPEKVRQAALAVDVPLGGTINGWGVKFKRPDSPDAGQNERVFSCVWQYQERKPTIVWPENLARAKPVMVPLPTWSQR